MATKSLAATPIHAVRPSLRAIKGTPDTANVLRELWEHAADGLTADELEWFAGAEDLGLTALSSLQNLFGNLASFIGEGEPRADGLKGFSCCDQADVFFFAAEEMARIRSLMEIAAAANYRLSKIDKPSSV